MTSTAILALDASPRVVGTSRTGPSGRALSRGLADLVGLIGVIYLFPITILAIGIPIALAINGLLLAAGWAWRALG